MTMTDHEQLEDVNEFNVFWFDPDGNTHKEREFVTAMEAVECARSLSTRPAAKLGVIRRIMITDGDDFCVFLWEDGRVVFPDDHTREMEARGDH